jgi:hypothetical protein
MAFNNKIYVTVYHETRAYGGSEEGGWYYQQGEPIDGVYTLCCGSTDPSVAFAHSSLAFDNHADDCPARGAAETFYRQYVLNHTEEYLRTFTHRPDGLSWLDSPDDTPDEYRGEVATSGTYYVSMDETPPESYPQGRVYYE